MSVIYRDLAVYLTVLFAMVCAIHMVNARAAAPAPHVTTCTAPASATPPARRAPRYPEDFV